MPYQEYLNERKDLYDILLQFIDDESNNDFNYKKLIDIIEKQKICENHNEMTLFLRLLLSICQNHHRLPNFFNKIVQIIQYLCDYIKATVSNTEVFEIIKTNKIIVLFFIENQVLDINEDIIKQIIYRGQATSTKYHYYFYPEIKDYLENQEMENIEKEISKFNNFDQLRKIGENESYICRLIRNDSIEEFITYVNKTNISLKNSTIKPSIFETNALLIEKTPTLIEYATFYGSIQIIQYLKNNDVGLDESLWKFAIHSNNPEIIEFIKEHRVYYRFKKILKESIKCHHNELTDYFMNENHRYEPDDVINMIICKKSLKYYNYKQIPNNLNDFSIFFDLAFYDYTELIDLYLKPKQAELDINENTLNINEIQKAANKNNIEIIYLLLKLSRIKNISECFHGCKYLEKVVLPKNINNIGNNAFVECYSLENISIPLLVESFGDYSFRNCNFKSIEMSPFITSIGIGAFYKCFELKEVVLPYSIKSIPNEAFFDCRSLEQVIIPSSVEIIGDGAFQYCSKLEIITFPSSLIKIGNRAFQGCDDLFKLELPPSLQTIGNNAFQKCYKLVEIILPPSLQIIGDNTFSQCSSFKRLNIPPSVTSIGKGAFSRCTSLFIVEIPPLVTLIEDDVFYGCSTLYHVKLPPSITSIGDSSFYECTNLNEINVPPSLTSIGPNCFYKCYFLNSLKELQSVKSIGENAFYDVINKNDKNDNKIDDIIIHDRDDDDSYYDRTKDKINGYLFYSKLSLLPVFIEFLITVIWWSRIHPWFSHGYKPGKTVYQLLEACWISLICQFASFLPFLLFEMLLYRKNRTIYNECKKIFIITIIVINFIFSLISIISGITASSYALNNNKCLKYVVNGYQGAFNWTANKSLEMQNNLHNWHEKMLKKAFDKNGHITNYYCKEVAIPTLIFAIFTIIIYLMPSIIVPSIFYCITIMKRRSFHRFHSI